MSVDYIEPTVRQRIPVNCLAGIERWLLTRIFKIGEGGGDSLSIHACLDFQGHTIAPDDELAEALTASRQICPELCAEVEREINETGEIDGGIDYMKIFQSIVRRHPDILPYVSVEEFCCNTRRGVWRETLSIITAQCIMSIDSNGNGRHELIPVNPFVIHRRRP